jgi:hypothetical protein
MLEMKLLKHFLPDGMLNFFQITEVHEKRSKIDKDMDIYIELEEKKELRSVPDPASYESKGFFSPKTIQDFPIRGKAVYLVIKRRRWRHKEHPNETVVNDYTYFADGVKMTRELSDFLKSTGRDPGRYD